MRNPFPILLLFILCPALGEEPFPALIPMAKPSDRKLSAAVERLYDEWNPHEDRANELFSNFKYSRLKGFDCSGNVSRRDPTKILKIDGVYHIWYTHRDTEHPPAGAEKATDSIPSTDWDLAEIWQRDSHTSYVPSPLIVDETLFFVKDKSTIFTGVDVRTGEEAVPTQRLEGPSSKLYSSPVAANGPIYFATRSGATCVYRYGDELKSVALNQLDDVFDASPAVAGDSLFLRGERFLYCIEEE